MLTALARVGNPCDPPPPPCARVLPPCPFLLANKNCCSANGVLVATRTDFASGYAATFGGAILNLGSATLTDVTFSGNVAAEYGGDVYQEAGALAATGYTSTGARAGRAGLSGGRGGSLALLGGTATLADAVLDAPEAQVKGGGCFVAGSGAVLTVAGREVANANLFGGEANADGGAVFVGEGGVLVGDGLTMRAPALAVDALGEGTLGNGGGLYVGEGAAANLTNLVCDRLLARAGACLYAFKSAVRVAGGRVTRNFGWDDENQAAAVFLTDNVRASITGVVFAANVLNPASEVHKGAALYMLESRLVLSSSSFANHSVVGEGGTMYVESLSVLDMVDVNITDSSATKNGGAMFLSGASVTLTNVQAWGCSCVGSIGFGGVIYAEEM